MSEAELNRIQGDLAVIRRAMGLRLSFGKGMLGFGILLSVAAGCAAVLSLLGESDWLQVGPLATTLIGCVLGLYVLSGRDADLSHEIKLQVVLSMTIYCVVWVATCGYLIASFLGPDVGFARIAALYALSIAYIFAFSTILILNALQSRERYYCLGLVVSLLLAGLLIPIVDRQYHAPLAHSLMAIGYLTGVVIQWVQLRQTAAHHAAD
jgi:hypothetical protein